MTAPRRTSATPLGRHPLDPPQPHAATVVYGKMIAQGILDRAEALAGLTRTVQELAPTCDRSGGQARITWALDDATGHWVLERARLRSLIARHVLEGGDRGLTSAVLLAAASEMNRRTGAPLLGHEVRETAAQAMEAWLRQRAPRRRRHA